MVISNEKPSCSIEIDYFRYFSIPYSVAGAHLFLSRNSASYTVI